MPRRKAPTTESTRSTSHAKPASRRKARPKFELPQEPAQTAAAAWAFRDADTGTATPAAAPVAPTVATPAPAPAPKPVAAAAPAQPKTDRASEPNLTAAMLIPVMAFGAVAIGTGIITGIVFIALQAMNAPARLASRMLRIGQN